MCIRLGISVCVFKVFLNVVFKHKELLCPCSAGWCRGLEETNYELGGVSKSTRSS